MSRKGFDKGPVVFFDGYCGLCSGSVQFILNKERKDVLYFMPLQSDKLKTLFPDFPFNEGEADSIVFFREGNYYLKSAAALRIARYLRFPFYLLYYFIFLPAFMRDPIYMWIASNRFKWFKRLDSLYAPDENSEDRFLD